MKLSVIIPVYNAANKIHIMIDSIIKSKLDFEVICVNDGSKDNSVNVIENYNDERIKVLTKENEGTFKAWQYGLKYASGEYVTIFDQDDYIDEGYIEYIYYFMDNIKADVLITPYYIEEESGENYVCEIGLEDGLYQEKDLYKIKDRILGGLIPYAKFTKVIKREVLQKQVKCTYQGQLRDFEDWLTMVEVFDFSDSIFIKNQSYYHYIQYSNSVSKSTLSYRKNFDSLKKIMNVMRTKTYKKIDNNNYKSFCFYALNILLNKCLSIEEYDLAKEIIEMDIYHNQVLYSNIKKLKGFILYTKSLWVFRIKNKMRRYKDK